MATDKSPQNDAVAAENRENLGIDINNTSTTDVGHHGANDNDPTGAKAAGGLVNSDAGAHSDAGDRPGSVGAFGAGGGGSNAGPAHPAADSDGDVSI
jgi:hypothetical protein